MKKEEGSITLEAAIFLSMFIMFYMALMDIVQIGRTQMILQYTLDETARELSQYTYILTKTGIVSQSMQTSKKSAEFIGKTEEVVNSVEELANALTQGGDVIGTTQVAIDNLEDYFANSEDLMQGVVAVVKNLAGNYGKEKVVEAVCKGSLKRQLGYLSSKEPDAYLQQLGIENGMSDITFTGTKWFDGSRELDIVMTYKMKYNLGILGVQEKTFKLRAKTAIW